MIKTNLVSGDSMRDRSDRTRVVCRLRRGIYPSHVRRPRAPPDIFAMVTTTRMGAVSEIGRWMSYAWVRALHGGIAGAVAVGSSILICRGANIAKAAFITGVFYTGFVGILFSLLLLMTKVTGDAIVIVVELIGLWMGLTWAAAMVPKSEPD